MKILAQSLFMGALLFIGCKKTSTSSAGTDYYTNRVFVYDEGKVRQSSEGTSISIENVNPVIRVYANASGEYQLPIPESLPVGAPLSIAFAKPGHGTFRYILANPGGQSLGLNDVNIGAPSSVEVQSFSITTVGDSLHLFLQVTSANNTTEKYVRFLHRKNAGGILTTATDISGQYVYPVQQGANNIVLHKSVFSNENNAQSGEPVYVKAFGDSYYGNACLTWQSSVKQFPNLNPNTCPEVSYIQP